MNKNLNKIIICNAPPGAGKDTLCNYVTLHNKTFATGKFADPLKKAAKELYGLTEQQVKYFESDLTIKNAKQDVLFGNSWREVLIDLSEKYMKPKYGKDVFGKILTNKINTMPAIGPFNLIISDGGFNEEVQPLVDTYGKDKVVIVRIHRKGCDFSTDSRAFIDAEKLGVKSFDITNKKIDKFFAEGYALTSHITKQ